MEEASARATRVLAQTPRLKDEILNAAAKGGLAVLKQFNISKEQFEAALKGKKFVAARRGGLEGFRAIDRPGLSSGVLEAIVRSVGRPPLLIQDGTYEKPPTLALKKQLEPHRKRINAVVDSVGRVEFRFHRAPWGGTGWMVDKNLMVTNRHVAEIVAESDRVGGFRFRQSPLGKPYEARIDYREEQGGKISREAPLVRVRFIAALKQPDVALFEVEEADFKLPPPIPLADKPVVMKQAIGVVGYPADDPERNDPEDIAKYFGKIFDVKRFAAGEISRTSDEGVIMHDATTLGGNSGSIVFDLASGKAVGLHFAGEYHEGNFAVDAQTIKKVISGLKTVVRGGGFEPEKKDSTHKADFFKGRDGYNEKFLGSAHVVKFPALGSWAADIAEATEGDGKKTKILDYRHFSLQYSKTRKMPIFTVSNIDGAQSRKVKRGDDQWFQDLRLPKELQPGEKDYGRDVMDRGHMVRREDPVWGAPDEAIEANFDTFHYTNACPQHADLNQRANAWQGLENFILESSRTLGLRATVFTGPVLRKDDPQDAKFPGLGRIPREFWKIVVAIDADTKKLYATGFVLTQGKMIADFTEAIVFGDWNSFQVPIAQISKATGLDFAHLEAIDTIGIKPTAKTKTKQKKKGGGEETVQLAGRPILLNSPSDMFLG